MISTIRLDLLQLFGKEYVIQHCMQELQRKQKEEAWKSYIADGIWCQGNNRGLTKRWYEVIAKPKEPEKTPEEIIDGLQAKFMAAGGESE